VKRSNRLIILVGVLLAVVAFVAIIAFLNQRRQPAADAEPQMETVLVAARDIAIGEQVTPDDVEEDEVDPEAVGPDTLRDPSQLRDRVALFAVPEGSQITESIFGQVGGGAVDIEGQLRAGEKAIAVQVDRATGLDFLIQQGDVIDIVLGVEIQVLQRTAESAAAPDQPPRFETVTGLESARSVKTVLQAKRVLYVSESRIGPAPDPDETPAPGEEEQPTEPTVVVIVFAGTNADAELVKFAQRDQSEVGAVTVTLRQAADTAIEETEGLTIDLLVERFGVPVPSVVDAPQTEPEETP
jgi:Flp pilus assembly protein CpaB